MSVTPRLAPLRYRIIETPVGRILLVENAAGVCEIRFDKGGDSLRPEPGWKRGGEFVSQAAEALRDYFAGKLRAFDLPLSAHGTPFQLRVWEELRRIPYGETISYGELARRIGKPNAFRAVGAANGRNPHSIVVPCHRVIGSDGSLTGFGGGLPIKKRLLTLEAVTLGHASEALPFES